MYTLHTVPALHQVFCSLMRTRYRSVARTDEITLVAVAVALITVAIKEVARSFNIEVDTDRQAQKQMKELSPSSLPCGGVHITATNEGRFVSGLCPCCGHPRGILFIFPTC